MRQLLLLAGMMAAGAPLAWAAGIELPAEVRPVYVPPLIVVPATSAPTLLTPTPLQAQTPTPTPTIAPAPVIAGGAAPQVCERPSVSECAEEATTCIAKKWVSRNHADSAEPVFYVTIDDNGHPHIVRNLGDAASDDDNAEAADCGGDLDTCLAKPCRE